jgi:hypothetical protein
MAMATCFGSPMVRTQIRGSVLAGKVRCSATPTETSRRSANYQPNSWDYDSLESLKTDHMVIYVSARRRIISQRLIYIDNVKNKDLYMSITL